MPARVAINGFGRMGRLALRAAWSWADFDIVHINEIAGDARTAAHLLKFDSIHGTWPPPVASNDNTLLIDNQSVGYSSHELLSSTPWQSLGIDLVIDCTGQFKTREQLENYIVAGVRKVVVSAPMKDGTLNIVMGVNDDLYTPAHTIMTAASCTTNCIAPLVAVVHEQLGIRHGTVTTIHNITNTQSVLDQYHTDLRRTRASGTSLIPTTTGSATAITEIFPELRGKLSGLAVRVPVANASIADCVFELQNATSAEAVNQLFRQAASEKLSGILEVEDQPLVSADFTGNTHSCVIDAPSTMVTDDTQLKVLAWYDNEIGYVHRMMELVRKVVGSL